jgi:hypothetical protein
MPIGKSSFLKSIFQSSIRVASTIFARENSEILFESASAYLCAICGLGWSPTHEQEASCALNLLHFDREVVVIDAGANVGGWVSSFVNQLNAPPPLSAYFCT